MIKKVISMSLVLAMCTGLFSACKSDESTNNETTSTTESTTTSAEELPSTATTVSKTITIDGSTASSAENTAYDGLGMVSANNSSRLLLDYKTENPDAYWELLNYLYGEDGMNLSLIKIEMGADIDSSSGTEPAVKRTEDETADVTRGAGYQLAADAMTINENVAVDLIYWGRPNWVANAEDKHEAVYQWYKQTIDALYDTYNVKVSYLTATQNERSNDVELIKYIAKSLDEETDERYDYGSIKIVAGEGVGTWDIADKMLEDQELMDAVDVITSHYTSFTTDNVKKVQDEYGKMVWFSEGASPMSNSPATYQYDGTGSGLSDINGMLDIATRITQAMTEGMTMYEFQPAIAAYYDGATYFPKQLIVANTPWSGDYHLDTGFYMVMQFNQFIKTGWNFIDDACFGDGVAGGDGHAIVDSTYNYVTGTDADKKDFSTVFVNNSDKIIEYTLDVSNIENAGNDLNVWETKGPDDSDNYYENFLQNIGTVEATDTDTGLKEYKVTVQPYSMVTVTTLDVDIKECTERTSESSNLALDYSDDFEYSDYDDDYLTSRGMAPRYTTDQDGAFEVVSGSDGNVLEQKITYAAMPDNWGSKASPITNLGDDTWTNYEVSIDAHFTDEKAESESDNYVGIVARYNLADGNYSGYGLNVHESGKCELKRNGAVVAEAQIDGLDISKWHTLKVSVLNNVVTCSVDDEEVITFEDNEQIINSGRVGIYSDYQNNYFDNLSVKALNSNPEYVTRIDDLDASMEYSEGSNNAEGTGWYFNTMCSFRNFNRTVTTGEANDTVSFTVNGNAFAIMATAVNTHIKVELNGEVVEENYECKTSATRVAAYTYYDLPEGDNTVKITVLDGSFAFDGVEVTK